MAVVETTLLEQQQRIGIARFRHVVRELRLPWIPIFILSVLVFAAIFANVISPHDPTKNDVTIRLIPPFSDINYPLGTDNLGKDILSRLIHGTRTILKVTAPAMLVAVLLGTTVGLVSGYAGRWIDSVLMRFTDAVMGFPSLLVALLVVSLLGTGLIPVLIAITATTWARFARMIHGEILSQKERDFVVLARISGVSPVMILWRHLFPNVVNTLMVLTSLTVGQTILLVASLSFLGLGLKPGEPSWGIMVAEGRRVLITGWWLSLFAGIAITAVVMAFNFFGDWLRDFIDPKLRRSR